VTTTFDRPEDDLDRVAEEVRARLVDDFRTALRASTSRPAPERPVEPYRPLSPAAMALIEAHHSAHRRQIPAHVSAVLGATTMPSEIEVAYVPKSGHCLGAATGMPTGHRAVCIIVGDQFPLDADWLARIRWAPGRPVILEPAA